MRKREFQGVGGNGDNGDNGDTPLTAVLGPVEPPPSVPSADHLAADGRRAPAAQPPPEPCQQCGCPGWWIPHSLDRWRCGDCEPWPTRSLARGVAMVVIGDDGQHLAEARPARSLRAELADDDEGEDSHHCDDIGFHEPLADRGGDPRLRGMHAVHYQRLADEAAAVVDA